MSRLARWMGITVLLQALLMAMPATATVVVPLSAETALPLESGLNPGFKVRVAQSLLQVPNSYLRAAQQINDTLLDVLGQPADNVAEPGSAPDGAFEVDTINFDLRESPVGVFVDNDNLVLEIPSTTFPGIPNIPGSTDYFTTEITGFLELAAGINTYSIVVSTIRTDANDDDDYRFFIDARPRDFFARLAAQYERFTIFSYPNNSENVVILIAPVAGLYPFRLLYWQTGRNACLYFFSVDPQTGDRILVNDPQDPRAVKVFRVATSSHVAEPCVGEVSPYPNSAGVNPGAPVKLVLLDGQTGLDDASIRLVINGKSTEPRTVLRDTNRVSLIYALPVEAAVSNATLQLTYASKTGLRYTSEWHYAISDGLPPQVAGQWDFDRGDLSATVGQPLEYFDGPEGLTALNTRFGTTDELGLPPIQDEVARVMEVPGDLSRSIGYVMHHGIAPNGSGTRVNQYTLIFDLMISDQGPLAASLIQISSNNNLEDGDLFWQGDNFGQGFSGYAGTSAFLPYVWHRVIAAYDMAANPPVAIKYLDGVWQDDWTAYQGLDHPRRALLPEAILFADGDADERRVMWVNSFQIRAGALTKPQMEALGGPTAKGIPMEIPTQNPDPSPSLKIERLPDELRISWAATPEEYVLEATPALANPSWQPVPGIIDNAVLISPQLQQQFFRLRLAWDQLGK